jgi:hypothetical protein
VIEYAVAVRERQLSSELALSSDRLVLAISDTPRADVSVRKRGIPAIGGARLNGSKGPMAALQV